MNCEHIEELLPAYAEGDLTRDEHDRVERHLTECDGCTESLAEFTALEGMLLERREQRPAAATTVHAVSRRLGFAPRRSPWHSLVGLPGAISLGLVMFGVMMIFFGQGAWEFVTVAATNITAGIPRAVNALGDGVNDATAGGNDLILLGLYLSVIALIGLTGSWMVMRYVRD